MTKGEFQQGLMNRSACIQIGALLDDLAASLDVIYCETEDKSKILSPITDSVQAIKHICDVLSDKVAGCCPLDDAWESADKLLKKILTDFTDETDNR